jgi:hypothetical protein
MSEDHPTLALDLPPVEQLAGSRGSYNAEQFRIRHPDKFAGIVMALGCGFKLNAIARAYGVAWETVRAIQSAELPAPLRESKRKLGQRMTALVERWVDELEDDPARVAKLSAIDIGILTDKGLLLQGEATSITERRDGGTNKFLSLMVSPGGEKSAKGREVDVPSTLPAAVGSGVQSLPPAPQPVDLQRSVSVGCALSESRPVQSEGGRGVERSESGTTHDTSTPTEFFAR